MFVDRAEISVKAGRGGNGAVSFHREKFVAAGGPDGGDGGRGGNIIVVADTNMSTLMDFRYKRKYEAQSGMDGAGGNKTGKDGKEIIIKVPEGTVIRDKETGAVIADMSSLPSESDKNGENVRNCKTIVLAKGGSGGWGNSHFATPTRQAPRFAKAGLPGESLDVILELKLLADVGLVGFPNVGKSTILSVISKAHPKIADYHFTTLFPNLGVVYVDDGASFVAADIPGLIEGASDGAGLGHDFLRHIERCRLIIHVVDVSGSEGRDPIKDFDIINGELKKYNPELASRPQIIAANKMDIAQDGSVVDSFVEYAEKFGHIVCRVSAATRYGIDELVKRTAVALSTLPPVAYFEPDYVRKQNIRGNPEDLKIENYDDVWSIEGEWIEQLMQNVNFSDYESRMFFDRVLRNQGVFKRLEDLGIKNGDTVSIYNMEFDYTE